jgi:hypothetical protein
MADQRVERLEHQVSNLESVLERLMKKLDENTNKMDNLISKGDNGSRESSSSRSRGKNTQGSFNSAIPKLAKLDFPRYNGLEDPTSWIYRAEQFFEYQQTEEQEKLPLATYHLEGEVQMWYQLFRESEELVTWEKLKANLYTRYGPTPFEDPFGELTKLRQIGSVKDYQVQFEQLLSRVGKLSSQHQLSCFISGLKDTIRTEVQAARPTSVTEAIGLARLFETRNWSIRKPITTDTDAQIPVTQSHRCHQRHSPEQGIPSFDG